jgi:hypothetical protein
MITNANLLERFALLGGSDAYIYDVKTKGLENVFENCNTLELTAKGDKVDIKEKGAIVLSVPKPMTSTLKFTAETTSFSKLAMALGSAGFELTTEQDNYMKNEMFEVTDTTSMVFNLSSEALSASDINVHLVTEDGELAKALAFTLDTTKKIVTVTADADIAVGDFIRINYSSAIASGKMYQFKVPTKTTNGSKKVLINAIGVNKTDASQVLMQFEFYKVNVETGITLTMDSDKQSSFDINMDVLADYNKLTDEEGSQFFRCKVISE